MRKYSANLSMAVHWTRKVSDVLIHVSVLHDSGNRDYPIHFKFGTNIYMLCKISCKVFRVHCPKKKKKKKYRNSKFGIQPLYNRKIPLKVLCRKRANSLCKWHTKRL